MNNPISGDFLAQIQQEVLEALCFVCGEGKLRAGDLVVVGASSSEVLGGQIGKASSVQVGEALVRGALAARQALGIEVAAQCCEHLNRALVMEADVARRRGYTTVSAVPYPKAGGSLASAMYRALGQPVLVEHIAAEAGLDIGDTLIGMHLRPVAVPVRGEIRQIGQAHVVMAYSRPKLIGGARARYALEAEDKI